MEAHSCLHQSMGDWASQMWGEKRKKVPLFLGGDGWALRKAFFGEKGIDGNNLLVVSASLENYLTNIYSSNICFCVPSSPYSCHSLYLSLSAVSLRPSSSTLPHPCVLWHLSWHSGEPAAAFSVLDLSHVMLTYVLKGCSAAKGPPRKRATITSSRKQSTARRWEGLYVCEGVVGGWGSQEAVFQEMELHYKKFDVEKRGGF